ncbi:hypothetical protein C944_02289 [Streptococcus pneumoniae 357]|nr:hypothetical protein C944_02289 [Streptococcus pneumoniae 357]
MTEKGINREDLFQLISYSYILKAEKAGLVFPSKDKVIDNEIGNLAGYGLFESLRMPHSIVHFVK